MNKWFSLLLVLILFSLCNHFNFTNGNFFSISKIKRIINPNHIIITFCVLLVVKIILLKWHMFSCPLNILVFHERTDPCVYGGTKSCAAQEFHYARRAILIPAEAGRYSDSAQSKQMRWSGVLVSSYALSFFRLKGISLLMNKVLCVLVRVSQCVMWAFAM